MLTKSAWSLFVLDAAVGFDQLLSMIQSTSLFMGYPVWMAMLLTLVMTGNAVQRLGSCSGLFLAALGTTISCAAIILFGISWSVHFECTLLLAVFFSTHVLLSLPTQLQLDGTFLNKLFGLRKLSNSEKQYIFGVSLVLLGAWFGSIPSILDWDRQWQQWPNTCLIGITIGHLIGALLVKMRVHIHVVC